MDDGCIENYLEWKLAGKWSGTVLRSSSTLIVNGDAWSSHLLRSSNVCGLEFGGNYDKVQQAIYNEVQWLLVCKLQLVFVFSNNVSDNTGEQARAWTSLSNYCGGKTQKAPFPTPPLVRQQVIASLKSLGAVLMYCEGDIVQEIAKIVADRNSVSDNNQPLTYAFGCSCDFIAMKDCPYIEMDKLGVFPCVDTTGQKAYQAEAGVVLSRRHLCSLLNVSEEQFVDWFLLIKCSTGSVGYNRSTDFNVAVPLKMIGTTPIVLDALLRIVVSNGTKRLHGATCNHRDEAKAAHLRTLQIQLSELRSYYNLQAWQSFNQHSVHRPSKLCTVLDLDYFERGAPDGYFASIAQYIEFAISSAANTTAGGTIAEIALQFTSAQVDVSNERCGFDHIRIEALRAMVQQLRNVSEAQQRGETLAILPPGLVPPERPLWRDVVAAFVFQKTCAKIRELLPMSAFGGEQNTPEQSFHGALFHSIVKQMRGLVNHAPMQPIESRATAQAATQASEVCPKKVAKLLKKGACRLGSSKSVGFPMLNSGEKKRILRVGRAAQAAGATFWLGTPWAWMLDAAVPSEDSLSDEDKYLLSRVLADPAPFLALYAVAAEHVVPLASASGRSPADPPSDQQGPHHVVDDAGASPLVVRQAAASTLLGSAASKQQKRGQEAPQLTKKQKRALLKAQNDLKVARKSRYISYNGDQTMASAVNRHGAPAALPSAPEKAPILPLHVFAGVRTSVMATTDATEPTPACLALGPVHSATPASMAPPNDPSAAPPGWVVLAGASKAKTAESDGLAARTLPTHSKGYFNTFAATSHPPQEDPKQEKYVPPSLRNRAPTSPYDFPFAMPPTKKMRNLMRAEELRQLKEVAIEKASVERARINHNKQVAAAKALSELQNIGWSEHTTSDQYLSKPVVNTESGDDSSSDERTPCAQVADRRAPVCGPPAASTGRPVFSHLSSSSSAVATMVSTEVSPKVETYVAKLLQKGVNLVNGSCSTPPLVLKNGQKKRILRVGRAAQAAGATFWLGTPWEWMLDAVVPPVRLLSDRDKHMLSCVLADPAPFLALYALAEEMVEPLVSAAGWTPTVPSYDQQVPHKADAGTRGALTAVPDEGTTMVRLPAYSQQHAHSAPPDVLPAVHLGGWANSSMGETITSNPDVSHVGAPQPVKYVPPAMRTSDFVSYNTGKRVPRGKRDDATKTHLAKELKYESRAAAKEARLEAIARNQERLAGLETSDGSVCDHVADLMLPTAHMPIDEYREDILQRIATDRVVFIHGETGCGKSTRLPQFLLEDAEETGAACRIIVCQPRRVAVTSMLKHLRPVLGNKVGLRMGFGERNETDATAIHYVTTGYLVGSMAGGSKFFQRCTHLVIDEVHERSADADLACLFAKDALIENPALRVILMSATIHTQLYRDYFSEHADASYGSMECLSVGRRRYPVRILYAEDLQDIMENGTSRTTAALRAHVDKLCTCSSNRAILTTKTSQWNVAVHLILSTVQLGTTVLVFLNGMSDITEMTLMLENHEDCWVLPLHSLVPHDEQDMVLLPTPPDKIKVILSTNLAESSMTIPDCDVVICLGTQKVLPYNAEMHKSQLDASVISKASAEQRAGRTGRTRPGTVYRLYSRAFYEKMREHAQSEVLEIPLQDLMLKMWCMLDGTKEFAGVSTLLDKLIEPPATDNMDQSYEQLYLQDLITRAGEDGELTSKGRLVGALPVECRLGKMITSGIILGVGAETIVIAALMSLPRDPFRHTNMHHGSASANNASIRRKFLTAEEYDEGCYSEPIMWLRVLHAWRAAGDSAAKAQFCFQHGLQSNSMAQLESSVKMLRTALVRHLPAESRTALHLSDPRQLSPSKLNALRLVMVWASSGNILQMKQRKASKVDVDGSRVEVLCEGGRAVTLQHFESFFDTVPFHFSPGSTTMRVYSVQLPTWKSKDYFMSLVHLIDGLMPTAVEQCLPVFWVDVLGATRFIAIVLPLARISADARDAHVAALRLRMQQAGISPIEIEGGAVYAESLREQISCEQDCEIIVVVGENANNIGTLAQLHELVPRSMQLVVPKNKSHSVLITLSNCSPGMDSLQRAIAATNLEAERDAHGVLTFPEAPPAMVRDLPLGHRLLSGCRFKGETSFAVQMDAEVGPANGVFKSKRAAADKLTLPNMCCYTPGWVNLRAIVTGPQEVFHYSEEEESKMKVSISLSSQSALRCSAHLGDEPLFAVALRTVLIGEGGKSVLGEGISFLPLGPTWLQLALLCVGADADAVLAACPDHASEATERQLELAAQVEEMLYWANCTAPRPDIVAVIDELFLSLNEAQDEIGVPASTED